MANKIYIALVVKIVKQRSIESLLLASSNGKYMHLPLIDVL